MKILLTLLLCIAIAVPALAGPPINGTYKSTNGDFDEGTLSSVYVGNNLSPANYLFAPDRYLHAQSYAGGGFTNDWEISCPQAVNVIPLNGALGSAGNGNYSFLITYTGGYITLGGPGNPWNGGDAVYTGVITSYTEIRTVQWVYPQIKGAVSDHAISATLQGYPESCVTWGIGNGVLRGGYDPRFDYSVLQNTPPANYPLALSQYCDVFQAGPDYWDDIKDLTLSITGCALSTQPTTWGAVKAKYRD